MKHGRRLVLIEINEVSRDLLQMAANCGRYPNVAKLSSYFESETLTGDLYESEFLEPWVQWVSIHAGRPSSQHHIKHLGDVPDLSFEQCWETLSKQDISTGVWGVMNGARNQAKNVPFFLPDPWTFSEKGYPPELNHLLDLPRYISKNYQNLSKVKLIYNALGIIGFILASKVGLKIFSHTKSLIKDLRKFGKKHFVFISYFDYISTLLFSHYVKTHQTQCAFLFLNSLAHLQHHHWKKGPLTITPEMLHGLKTIDRLFDYLFKAFPEHAFVVHNGLSQMNTNHEKPWVLYRQKDPMRFLKTLNIPAIAVEQHMTHDGHVFFANKENCQQAYSQLKAATILGKPLFHVELNQHDDCKLFYMLKFTDELKNVKLTFEFKQGSYLFLEHFDSIVRRTGRHIPVGTIFSDTIAFADQMLNHDFNLYLFNYFKPEVFTLPEIVVEEEFV